MFSRVAMRNTSFFSKPTVNALRRAYSAQRSPSEILEGLYKIPVQLKKTSNTEFPYKFTAEGRLFRIRLNDDHPNSPLLTVMENGRDIVDLDAIPNKWTEKQPASQTTAKFFDTTEILHKEEALTSDMSTKLISPKQ